MGKINKAQEFALKILNEKIKNTGSKSSKWKAQANVLYFLSNLTCISLLSSIINISFISSS